MHSLCNMVYINIITICSFSIYTLSDLGV